MLKNLSLFSLLFLLIAVGCSKFEDIGDAEIKDSDAEFAVPLATARTSFKDIIENFDEKTFITIDPDGLIRLRYQGDVATKTSDEIMASARNSVPPLLPIDSSKVVLPFSSPEELEVDSAVFKGTKLSFYVTEDSYETIDFTLTLPQTRKDGVPWSISLDFVGNVAIGPPLVPFYDLDGYALVPDNGQVFVEYTAINQDGDEVQLDNVVLQLEGVDFSYVEGYLGVRNHNGERDTIEIEFFESWIDGEVHFEDPKILINLENSFGIPTRSVINIFDIYTADGLTIPLEAEELNIADNQGIDFLYPTTVGEVTTQTFTFDKTNSNIIEVLGSRPTALDYDVDAKTNPDSLVEVRGFLTDESFYRVLVEVELPIYGAARGFVAEDEFDVDFSEYTDVRQAEFKIISDNGTPLDIGTQLYFYDNNGTILDSLLIDNEKVIAAAPVDEEGVVIENNTKTTLVDFDAARFSKILDTKKLILQTAFSTINNGETSVKVFSDQEIEVRLGMKFINN